MKDTAFCRHFSLNIKGKILDLDRPLVMGILNLTPDSFYSGSRHTTNQSILKRAERMLLEGAAILDIGGYSSRPGADNISVEEEINRISGPISMIKKEFPSSLISIDTFRSEVAQIAIEQGADIINDISGGKQDGAIFSVAAKYKTPYILMHMRGTPQTMTKKSSYQNLLTEVIYELSEQVSIARKAGVIDIIVDPGFGFAKNINQNFELLHQLDLLSVLNAPVLVGISRKSMIYKTLNTDAENALNGTTVLNTIALLKGASILRVHDVKEAYETVELYTKMINR